MVERICLVLEDGKPCGTPPRSARAEWCKMHYHRWYRHGSVDVSANRAAPTVSHGRRYRTVHRPDHPLAPASGRVYIHRLVLYTKIGPGPHPCHWCKAIVRWTVGVKVPGMLVPDHLNGIGDDNRPENLVPSCMPCNSDRGSAARMEALKQAGWWSNHDTIAKLKAQNRKVRAPEQLRLIA